MRPAAYLDPVCIDARARAGHPSHESAPGHDDVVPDDLDYRWLAELIATPDDWTPTDLASAEAILTAQKQAVDDAHPADRDRLRAVVDQLESAIERHRRRDARA